MLDAGHALKYRLQRLDDQLLDFFGRCPRLGDDDVGRGHHDLGVLFPRRQPESHQPGEEREHHQQYRQLAVYKVLRSAAGDIQSP
jgi:hypothetical protein